MSFICIRMKNHFHNNDFALSLARGLGRLGNGLLTLQGAHILMPMKSWPFVYYLMIKMRGNKFTCVGNIKADEVVSFCLYLMGHVLFLGDSKGPHVIGVNVFLCGLMRFLSNKRPDRSLLYYSLPSCACVESTPCQEVGFHRIYLFWRSNKRLSTKLRRLSICQDWPASPFPAQWEFHF